MLNVHAADGSIPTSGGGATTLDGLTDVVITAPADNEVLGYDSGSATWINQTAAETGLAAASHSHVAADVSDFSEAVDDRVNALLVAGTNMTLTYNDGANTLTLDAAGGGGSSDNEAAASALTDATATGDAGSRADHFPGTSLDGAWSQEGTAPSTSTVKYSAWRIIPDSGNELGYWLAFTPSGAFTVECRVRLNQLVATGGQAILACKDSSSGTISTGEWMLVGFNTAGTVFFASVDAGTETTRASHTDDRVVYGWVYLRLARDGSNGWTGSYSYDRVGWLTIGTYSKTFTVAKLGRRDTGSGNDVSFDFVDVVS